ncbi:MAG: non-ribosomal peptide synthetase, partial [Candidatus Aminicenantes bacterium]
MKTRKFSGEKAVVAIQNVKEKDYWLHKLSGHLTKNHFPYDFKNKPGISIEPFKFKFSGELLARLMKVSSAADHMLHMILTAAAALLLQKYTAVEDIIVGTSIYKQDIDFDMEFINTVLPLRNRINTQLTFKELLKQVRQTIVEAIENQNYPIEILAERLNLPSSHNDEFPLFDILILLENIQDRKYIHHIKTNMVFSFSRQEECIKGVIQYNSSCFRESTIQRITAHLKELLQNALSDGEKKLSRIEILSEQEKHQLLFEFNNTQSKYPAGQTIQRLFEEQVEKNPDSTA